jgi:hypothetical protein
MFDAFLSLVFFLVFLLIAGCAGAFSYLLLRPITRTRIGKRGSSQYHIVDFFPLTFLLAIVFVYVGYSRRSWGRDTTMSDVASAALALVVVYAWWRGAVALSRIGVTHSGRRFVFLAFVLPVALLGGALGVPIVIGGFFVALVGGLADGWFAFVWLVAFFAISFAAVFCSNAVDWVLSGIDRPSDTESSKTKDVQDQTNPL